MKKTVANPKILRYGERGAALLFALGTLSLILLLTMAFVADSMMQRKIAANRAGRVATEVIAESALNHARALLFAMQYNPGQVISGQPFRNNDINALRCYGTDDRVQVSDPEVLMIPNWDGTIPPTWWRYVHPGTSDDPIVGRYTFVMLQDEEVRYPELKDLPVSNETVEWGTVEEFLLLSNPYSRFEPGQFSVFPAEFSDAMVYRRLETRPGVSLDAFLPGDWQKLNVPTRSVLPERRDYCQRFNLRRNDWDTMRGSDGGFAWVKKLVGDANSDGTLADNEEFVSVFSTDPGTGALEFSGAKTSTIAALSRVADTAGTFAERKFRQYQIAANLIDYCDSDSVPTSDVLPENWSDTTPNIPKFTGNEKTRYIDRFGLTAWPLLTVGSDDTGVYFSARARWSLLAGLVDMYGVSGSRYRLKINLRDGANYPVRITVSNIAISCSYQYIDGDSQTQSGTAVYYSALTSVFGNAASNSLSMDFAAAPQGGYQLASWYGGDSVPTKEYIVDRATLESYIDGLVPAGGTLQTDTIAIIGIAADAEVGVSVGLSSLILEMEEGTDDWKRVDYARVSNRTFSNSIPAGDPNPYKQTGWIFLNNTTITPLELGFSQAVFTNDPRQNLNTGDWTLEDFTDSLPGDAPGYFGFSDAADAAAVFATTGDTTPIAGTDLHLIADRDPSGGPDLETRSNPAFSGGSGLSTAVIRNAPMTRLSELGRIHRGAKWETLNISHVPAFGNLPATDDGSAVQRRLLSYADGDGWLLDCVTVRDPALTGEDFFTTREFFDLNLRSGSNFTWDSYKAGDTPSTSYDEEEEVGDRYFRRLFMTTGTSTFMGESVPWETSLSTDEQQKLAAWLNYNHADRPVYGNRSDLLAKYTSGGSPVGGFDALAEQLSSAPGDKAVCDKLVSDIMMRSTAVAGDLSNTMRLLVVAQSIRDIGGEGTAITVNGVSARIGDFESAVDEITGELRMIVTLVRDPVSGVFVVQSVEYLEDAY